MNINIKSSTPQVLTKEEVQILADGLDPSFELHGYRTENNYFPIRINADCNTIITIDSIKNSIKTLFEKNGIVVINTKELVDFEDPEVEKVLLRLTGKQDITILDLNNLPINSTTRYYFGSSSGGNTDIQYFNELKYFKSLGQSNETTVYFGGCNKLKEISFPTNFRILLSCFRGCDKLEKVTVPSIKSWSETTTYDSARGDIPTLNATSFPFRNNFITSMYVDGSSEPVTTINFNAENTTKINPGVFAYVKRLNSIDLNGVTSIGIRAFLGCLDLEEVNNYLISTIPEYTFANCTKLTNFDFSNITSIGERAFMQSGLLGHLIIPETVTSMIRAVFRGTNISKLTILGNPSITHTPPSTNDGTFAYCNNLIEVNCPNLTSIGTHFFLNCPNLTKANFLNCETIGHSCFGGCTNLSEINFPKLKLITGDYAFNNCSKLENVELPELETISSRWVFTNCSSIKYFNLPKLKIGSIILSSNSALEILKLPCLEIAGNNKAYYEGLIWDCTKLHTVIIPNVKLIYGNAFGHNLGVSSIQKIYLPKDVPILDLSVNNYFSASRFNGNFYIPTEEAKQNYLADSVWGTFAESRFIVDEEWNQEGIENGWWN